MKKNTRISLLVGSFIPLIVAAGCADTPRKTANNDMSFFISSVGSGKGADLGGLTGADQLCQTLAEAAGVGNRTWHAYLSTSAVGETPGVNARDRIGNGPWQNVNGIVIATNLSELHGANNLNKQTALTEAGDVVNGNEDTPNKHDILTGTQPDGTAFTGNEDKTCGNWTKSGEGSAIVGHHNRNGSGKTDATKSWNSAHGTRGCSQDALQSTGGAGLLYCFVVR